MEHKVIIYTKSKQVFRSTIEYKHLFDYRDFDFDQGLNILSGVGSPAFFIAPGSIESITIDPCPKGWNKPKEKP